MIHRSSALHLEEFEERLGKSWLHDFFLRKMIFKYPQGDVVDDVDVTDSRLMLKFSVGYSFSKFPIRVVFAVEGINRTGFLKNIVQDIEPYVNL